MPSWTYADYPSQSSNALRLTRARLFKSELLSSVGKTLSADGKAVSYNDIVETIKIVDADIVKYEASPDGGLEGGRGGTSYASFNERE